MKTYIHAEMFLRYLIAFVACLAFTIPGHAQVTAQYGFEGNVNDTSGNGLNGVNHGVTYTTGVIGGQAGVFNGSSTYVDLNNPSTTGPLKPALPVTVSAWVYLNNNTTYERIFSSDNADNVTICAGYCVSFNPSGELECFYGDAAGTGSTHDRAYIGTEKFLTGQWYHVAAVIQGATNMQLYVNGQLINGNYSGTGGTMAYTTTTSKIGTGNTTGFFNGNIDGLQIYHSALTASQIALLAQGAMGYWGFNEGSGTTTTDETGNGLIGTLVNSPVWTTGIDGDALKFNGTNNYVNLSNTTTTNLLKPTLPVTIGAWVNLASTAAYQRIYSSDNDDNGSTIAGSSLSLTSTGVLECFYGDAGGSGTTHLREKVGTTALHAGTWYYVSAVIRGPTNMSLYVNGVDDGGTYSGTGGTMGYTTTSSKIATSNTLYFLNGIIDDLSVYNVSLTPYGLGLPETIGGGTVSSPAVGPQPSYGVDGTGYTLVKNWHFGTDGTITNTSDMSANFYYHDNFGTDDNGGNYGAVTVAPDYADALHGTPGQPYEGEPWGVNNVPVPTARSFTTDSLQTYLVPLGGVTTVTPASHNAGCGSFQPKWNLASAGSTLGQDILWETRVRYVTPPYFYMAIWDAGNYWTPSHGPEMDLIEDYGYDNGGGSTNYVGKYWHSNTVAGTDQVNYHLNGSGGYWNTGMASVGINTYDATQYHIWTQVYHKDNTYEMFVDGTRVQYGSGPYAWTNSSTGAAEPLYFRFDFGWGSTVSGNDDFPLASSALVGTYYEINYSRVYLR